MSGRQRSRGAQSSVSYTYTYTDHLVRRVWSGGVIAQEFRDDVYTTGPAKTYDDRETMSDTVGQYTTFNGCIHTKRISVPISGPTAKWKPTLPTNYPSYLNTWAVYGRTVNSGITGGFTPVALYSSNPLPGDSCPDPDWEDLVFQVGSQLDGRMQTGQNLLVDIAQIVQTINMVKHPFSFRKVPKLLRNGSLSELSKAAAGGFLEYKFGWENLYRDIKAIADVWKEVRLHQDYLRESVNKYVSCSSSGTEEVSNPGPILGSIGGAYDPSSVTDVKVSKVTKKGTFSLDIRRTQAALAWSRCDQVLARLGINDLAEALWDCVPYSFVVDWFTHLNRIVRRKPIEWNAHTLTRIGWSRTTTWEATFKVKSYASGYGGSQYLTNDVGPFVIQRMYERYPGFPSGTSSVGLFGDLSTTQIAEGIALIVQRL